MTTKQKIHISGSWEDISNAARYTKQLLSINEDYSVPKEGEEFVEFQSHYVLGQENDTSLQRYKKSLSNGVILEHEVKRWRIKNKNKLSLWIS